ncbi:MAG: SDR family NAD(P)-dependent oxidoreductase [Candidatus Omnitrophota bacterium]
MNPSENKKVILITGCSSGFGLLTAARLSGLGHHVFATMRNLQKKDALLAEVKKRGGTVNLLELDVNNVKTIEIVVQKIEKEFGRIDVLVNNAGFGVGGFFEDLSETDIRQQMDTNFFGVQSVTRAVIPLMRKNHSGKIINLSSIAGLYALPAFSAYNASKWAVEGFSESLLYELKPFGISVCLIEPGTYRTTIFFENRRCAKDFDNPKSPYYGSSQALKKRVDQFVANDKKDPEDIAILIEKLINSPRPPFRNIPDRRSKILYFLRRFLPFGLFSFILYTLLFFGTSKKASGQTS